MTKAGKGGGGRREGRRYQKAKKEKEERSAGRECGEVKKASADGGRNSVGGPRLEKLEAGPHNGTDRQQQQQAARQLSRQRCGRVVAQPAQQRGAARARRQAAAAVAAAWRRRAGRGQHRREQGARAQAVAASEAGGAAARRVQLPGRVGCRRLSRRRRLSSLQFEALLRTAAGAAARAGWVAATRPLPLGLMLRAPMQLKRHAHGGGQAEAQRQQDPGVQHPAGCQGLRLRQGHRCAGGHSLQRQAGAGRDAAAHCACTGQRRMRSGERAHPRQHLPQRQDAACQLPPERQRQEQSGGSDDQRLRAGAGGASPLQGCSPKRTGMGIDNPAPFGPTRPPSHQTCMPASRCSPHG